ncbi:MAG: M48 family metalloprotease, partial [Acidobacteria bacterium]|nr:M48 family metalloprotease [Acidobacteriota bacterium]
LGAFASPIQASPIQASPTQTDKQEQADKKAKEKEKKDGGIKTKVGDMFGIGDKEQRQERAQAKSEREYQKMLADARKKYDAGSKDHSPDFKYRVDQDYKEVRRQHSDYGFQMNTFNSNDDVTTFTGDKLKLEDTLYDNEFVQDYVNRVGQALVPATSAQRYIFKVVLNPVPDARSLSTGTVYITTGYLALVDNEAQLAYILGHEVAHIEKLHWLQDSLVSNEMEDFNRKQEKIQGYASLAAGGLGTLFGGAASGSFLRGMQYGYFASELTALVMKFVKPTKSFAWDRVQENEADKYGMELMFERNYDPREVPKLYARLQQFNAREPRTSDGFVAQADRVLEGKTFSNFAMVSWSVKPNLMRGAANLRARRGDTADGGIVSPLEPGKTFGTAEDAEKREKGATQQMDNLNAVLREKLEKGEIIGSSEEFQSVMADLKRDNGIRAFYFDMYQMALDNLREALQIRSNDPYTHFYYGKVLHATARSKAEKAEALSSIIKAIETDKRGVLAGPWMHRALVLMADRNPAQNREIIGYLRQYVDVYQQEHGGGLPPNMDVIYAYLKDLGDDQWAARPAMNISTKNLDPIKTAGGQAAREPAPLPAPQPQPSSPPASAAPNNVKRKP